MKGNLWISRFPDLWRQEYSNPVCVIIFITSQSWVKESSARSLFSWRGMKRLPTPYWPSGGRLKEQQLRRYLPSSPSSQQKIFTHDHYDHFLRTLLQPHKHLEYAQLKKQKMSIQLTFILQFQGGSQWRCSKKGELKKHQTWHAASYEPKKRYPFNQTSVWISRFVIAFLHFSIGLTPGDGYFGKANPGHRVSEPNVWFIVLSTIQLIHILTGEARIKLYFHLLLGELLRTASCQASGFGSWHRFRISLKMQGSGSYQDSKKTRGTERWLVVVVVGWGRCLWRFHCFFRCSFSLGLVKQSPQPLHEPGTHQAPRSWCRLHRHHPNPPVIFQNSGWWTRMLMRTYKNPDKQRVLFSIKKQAARVLRTVQVQSCWTVEKQK